MADLKPPRVCGEERETLLSLLRYQRESLVRKVTGVDEAAARASAVPSGTTLPWLVTHLTAAEVLWMQVRFAGLDVAVPADTVEPDEAITTIVSRYRDGWARTDDLALAASLDEPCPRATGKPGVNLRWVLAHLLAETARHAGHADILRELGVDGLLSLPPEPDANVIYSFHLYEPVELTALGAYRTGLDTDAMARLPFPVTDEGACKAIAGSTGDPPTADLMRFYCAQHWDVAKLTARIAAAAAWGRRHQVPVLAGEFGASQHLNAPARLAWLTGVRTAFEQNTIGWALWGYDDLMGLARHPPNDHRRLDPDLLHALGLVR